MEFKYRGFRIQLLGEEPTLATILDPMNFEQMAEPLAAQSAWEAARYARQTIDALCERESSSVITHIRFDDPGTGQQDCQAG